MKILGEMLFFILSTSCFFGQKLTDDQIQQKLLEQPPQTVVDASRKGVRHKVDPIVVTFVNADMDGSGAFRYYVALYSTQSGKGGFLRVFKRQGADLTVAGGQESIGGGGGGYQGENEKVGVYGDGKPEGKANSVGPERPKQH